MMKNQQGPALQTHARWLPSPAPWQGRLASLPTHSDRAAVGTPPAPLCLINTTLIANR